jgi:glycosylphosphatidylinositol transamidase (GPIT) subunit GPI8
VVMAYDDIANNPENPMPGKVFNRPGTCHGWLV